MNERFIAVDVNGQEHICSGSEEATAGNVTEWTVTFRNLPLKQIKRFQFQVRPYQWVEFRNVSLQPGEKTNVQVVVPDMPSPGAQPPKLDGRGTALPAEKPKESAPAGPILTYEVDPASALANMSASEMESLVNAIDQRLNSGTEKLARVRKLDDGRIEVALLRGNDADRQARSGCWHGPAHWSSASWQAIVKTRR